VGVLLGKLEPASAAPTPLAGKSTLNRLEHAPGVGKTPRYHKIGHDGPTIETLFVDLFLDAHQRAPRQIVLDLDATDDPLHGDQEGRFFHGYYDCYCYLPLYVFCGRHLIAAKLRRSDIDGSAGAVEEMDRIAAQIRERWPRVKIVLRADSGFAREALMAWCEANKVDYVFGLARNARLEGRIADALDEARLQSLANAGQPARVFRDFDWSTKDSWSRRRRVIGKAEWARGGANPRFLVTSLKPDAWRAKPLYEKLYCARGEMENRIKECQGDLFADRTSTATMRANQVRLWFASMAYILICALRRIGLAHTQLANATCGTIRLKLLKLGGLVKVSARPGEDRLRLRMSIGRRMAPRRGTARPRPRLAGLIRAAAPRPSPQKPSAHRRKIPNSAELPSASRAAQRRATSAAAPKPRPDQRFNQRRREKCGLGRDRQRERITNAPRSRDGVTLADEGASAWGYGPTCECLGVKSPGRPWILERSATRLREADLDVLSKFGKQGLE
jgi:Transposase DDE domain group 1